MKEYEKPNPRFIKVLKCQNVFYDTDWFEPFEYYSNSEEIKPIYNRDGYYHDRKTKFTWEEFRGRAFRMDAEMFIYRLQIQSHVPWSAGQLEAYRILQFERRVPKVLKDEWYIDYQWRELRNTYRSSAKHVLAVIRELDNDRSKPKDNYEHA